MTKPELGIKRDCPSCGARFYDLNRSPAHCPKCEHDFVPEALLKPRKRREDEAPEEVAKPAAEAPLSEADKENKGAKSKKKPGLDEEGGEAAPDGEDIDIEDIEVDVEDADADDTLLEEDEDDDEVGDIVGGGGDDEA